MGRARDDLDMERALRPRINAPDVVRSTLSHKELKYNESTIDQLLGTPNKIVIPERYIPEQVIFIISCNFQYLLGYTPVFIHIKCIFNSFKFRHQS